MFKYKYKAYSDAAFKELISSFPSELLALWAEKLGLKITGKKYEEILEGFMRNLDSISSVQKKQLFNLYKNGIRPSSFIIESDIISEKLLVNVIEGFKNFIKETAENPNSPIGNIKFIGLELLNSRFLGVSDSYNDMELAKIFFTFVGKEVETEQGVLPLKGYGIIVFRPLKNFLEVRCDDVKVVNRIVNFLSEKFGIRSSRIMLGDKTVKDILEWSSRVNLASIQLFEGPLHRHIMSTKKKRDLREVSEFLEKLEHGKITSLHMSVFTEENYEIGFKLNPKLGRVSFTKIVSEYEIEQILSAIFEIYRGKKVIEGSRHIAKRGKKYAKLDIFLR